MVKLRSSLVLVAIVLTGCTQSGLAILDGATHAKGTLHVEGYFTDSQGEVELCKVPDDYTAADAKAYCGPEG